MLKVVSSSAVSLPHFKPLFIAQAVYNFRPRKIGHREITGQSPFLNAFLPEFNCLFLNLRGHQLDAIYIVSTTTSASEGK